jgi:hypothetical protein
VRLRNGYQLDFVPPPSAPLAGISDSLFDPREVFTNVQGHFDRHIPAGWSHPLLQ